MFDSKFDSSREDECDSPSCSKEEFMKKHCQLTRLAWIAAFSFVTIISLSTASWATGNIVKSDLTGTWQIALRGTTGCGFASMLANATLNSTGSGTASLQTHGACGDSSLTGVSFTINTLKTNGSGTAGLACGIGCGWTFDIQVAPDRNTFSLVDVSSANPGNFLEGVAVLASPSGDIVTPDLTGSWQMTLYGQGGCGVGSSVVTFTLNSSGCATNAASTSHSVGCGDTTSSGNTFTILSLNANGSGTAGLSCGTGCGFTLNIQVSPDRSSFNVVDVSSANPGNFLAGFAVNNSTAAKVTIANLVGKWQLALYGQGGCGIGSEAATFTLNVKGLATNVAGTAHNVGCGDSTFTGGTFSILSMNANGSGTAGLSCGTGCGFTLNIQVSPDRSTFNVVDVSTADPGNFLVGTAIHE
jgi:hypothetical protein